MSYENLFLKKVAEDFNKYSSLPMAVFSSSAEGTFLNVNAVASAFFGFSQADVGRASIKGYYLNDIERTIIIQRLKEVEEDGWLKNETLRFQINGKNKSVRFFARPYFLPRKSEKIYIGCICLMHEITELERFREIEKFIPISTFDIDTLGNISYSNPNFKELFKYYDEVPIVASTIFDDETDYADFMNELRVNKQLLDKQVKLKRKDGSSFFGKFTVLGEFTGKAAMKVKGFVEDVTFDSITHEVPIGMYCAVVDHNGTDVILSANNHFAQIIGYHSEEECRGIKMKDLHPSEKSYDEFRDKLRDADRKNSILRDCVIDVRAKNGDIKEVIVNTKILRDGTNKIIGRVGAVYDVTHDLKRKFQQVEQDFASLLHSFSAMSTSVRDSLQTILDENIREPGANTRESFNLFIDDNINKLLNSLKGLRTGVNTFLKIAQTKNAVTPETVQLILSCTEKYNNCSREDGARILASRVREITFQLRKQISNFVKSDHLSRDDIRIVNNELNNVLAYARLLTLDGAITELQEMMLDIDLFKESLYDDEGKTKQDSINIVDIISSVINSLDEFAYRRNIEVRFFPSTPKALFKGDKRYIHNVLYNVIHNAIKYSFYKTENKPWVGVRLEVKNGQITIEIENRGVAISREEIKNESIFDFGSRGSRSSDRNRPGMGIGLWHSKKIIDKYKGTIRISSEPLQYNKPDDYTKPFITTFTISLPQKNEYEKN